MSHFFILIESIIATAIVYKLCKYTKLNAILRITLACIMGACVYLILPSDKPSFPSDTLIVGVSPDFPPFCFIEHDTITGFDIELIQEIAHRLHKKIELRTMPFSTLLPSLQLGAIQIVASGITPTPERARHVLFTTPYIDDGALVLVSMTQSPVYTIADLHDQEVAVNQGYTADQYISAMPNVRVRRLTSPAQALLALKSGRVAAFITAKNTVHKEFFDQSTMNLFHISVLPDTTETNALAVTPKNPELLTTLQETLNAMQHDGSLQQLRTKWGL